jgi:hypothetical protein
MDVTEQGVARAELEKALAEINRLTDSSMARGRSSRRPIATNWQWMPITC